MPVQDLKLMMGGKVNRRDPIDELAEGDVRSRENFMVVGVGKNTRVNKKMSGSSRYSTNDITDSIRWLARYYNENSQTRKTFAFANGKLYHYAPNGDETEKITDMEATAIPDHEIMKVSGNIIMYVVDGSTGMRSHDGNEGHDWITETDVTLNFVKIVSHLDRLWGFEENSDNLYFSANLAPTDFTSATDAGVITIGAQRGSRIKNVFLWNEVLYILKEDLPRS